MQFQGDFTQSLATTFSSDGIISSITGNVEDLTGFSPHEVVGMPITQILGDRSVFDVLQMINTATKNGFWEGEVVHRSRDGRSLPTRGRVLSLSGRQKQDAGYLLLSTYQPAGRQDPAVESALNEVAAKLRAFAHELNNPLAVTMGFTQLILLNSSNDSKIRSDMERLYSEMQRVIQVVEKMHGYARSMQSPAQPQLARKTS